jgi:RNA polymerase sigma-70 factor (ECF subfamily)
MDALAWLYAHYPGDVYRFILYLSGDQALAEDITSEVFIRVRDAPEPTRTATVKAYLFAIARNLFLNEIRRRSRRASLDERLVEAAPGPERSAEHSAALTEILRALQQLPEVDRSALLMRAFHQLSYKEIGTALHLSPVTARVKVPRARLKLAHLKGSME